MTPTTQTNPYSKDGSAARDDMILAHLPLVKRIAHGFAARLPRGIERADLIGTGTVGLIRAVDRFDPRRGVTLEAFAGRCIREAILDFLRGQDLLPYSTRVKIRRLESSMTRLQQELGRPPAEEEIADRLGITAIEVSSLLAQASSLPLHMPDDYSGRPAGSQEPAAEAATVVDKIEKQQVKEILTNFIRALPDSERIVLMLYYFEGLRMKEIAEVLDLTESRISQIHGKALTFLRASLPRILDR